MSVHWQPDPNPSAKLINSLDSSAPQTLQCHPKTMQPKCSMHTIHISHFFLIKYEKQITANQQVISNILTMQLLTVGFSVSVVSTVSRSANVDSGSVTSSGNSGAAGVLSTAATLDTTLMIVSSFLSILFSIVSR